MSDDESLGEYPEFMAVARSSDDPADAHALVRGYSDQRLAECYRESSRQPGTLWHRMLSDEIGRRDGGGR
jgi:hypothetical protein